MRGIKRGAWRRIKSDAEGALLSCPGGAGARQAAACSMGMTLSTELANKASWAHLQDPCQDSPWCGHGYKSNSRARPLPSPLQIEEFEPFQPFLAWQLLQTPDPPGCPSPDRCEVRSPTSLLCRVLSVRDCEAFKWGAKDGARDQRSHRALSPAITGSLVMGVGHREMQHSPQTQPLSLPLARSCARQPQGCPEPHASSSWCWWFIPSQRPLHPAPYVGTGS